MASANGRLLASELALIPGTNEHIRKDLLPQLVALMGAFKARFGRDLKITDGYRSYDEQVALKKAKPYLAGTPGTSKHGWGIAVDLGSGVQASFTSPEHLWLRANGPAFGLFIPAWAQVGGSKPEQWHWEFSSGVVKVSNYQHIPGAVPHIPTVTPPSPLTPTVQEDDMLYQILWSYGAFFNRSPTTEDVTYWLAQSVGKNVSQVADLFLNSLAERGSVTRAYTDFLGRNPSEQDITNWLSNNPTVRAVRAGVYNSDEAKGRR